LQVTNSLSGKNFNAKKIKENQCLKK
jgi:hypothetical protein